MYTIKGDFDLKDLKDGLAWVESFQLYQWKRNASAHVIDVAHAGGGRAGA